MLGPTAHVDTFARDNLPPTADWPDFLLEGFDYPEYLNAAVELIRPHGRARLRRSYRADRTRPAAHLQGTHRLEQSARPCAGRELRRQAGQSGAGPLGEQSRDDRDLARRHQGRRRRRQYDADVARRRTLEDRRQGGDRARALRHPHLGGTGRLRQGQQVPEAGRRFRRHRQSRRRTRSHRARQAGALRGRQDRARRRRAARLHLGHHGRAQSHDAFPSRHPHHRRRLRQTDSERPADRRLRRLAADRLHLRARRARGVPAALRRRRRVDRERHSAEPHRHHRDLQGDGLLHRADRLSRDARRDRCGRETVVAAAGGFRGRNSAGADLRELDRAHGRPPARRHGLNRNAARLHLQPDRRPQGRRDREARAGLRGQGGGRSVQRSPARRCRTARGARADRLPLPRRRPAKGLRQERLERHRRRFQPGRGRLFPFRGAQRRHDHLCRLQHRRSRGRGGAADSRGGARMRRGRRARRGARPDRRGACGAEGRRDGGRRDDSAAAKPRQGDDRALQISALDQIRRQPAEDPDRQDPALSIEGGSSRDDRRSLRAHARAVRSAGGRDLSRRQFARARCRRRRGSGFGANSTRAGAAS